LVIPHKVAHMKDIQPISGVDLRLTGGSWDFAEAEKTQIAAHWQKLAEDNPRIWNGGVLICHHAELVDGIFHGRFLTSDYAGFVAWRDWGNPGPPVYNAFGSAVVRSRDGALLYGRMAQHTLNAGRIYPPGGSLEPDDVLADGSVDVMGSIIRELKEETGLEAADAKDGGLLLLHDGPRIAIAQIYDFDLDATALAAKANAYLATQHEDELDGVEMIVSHAQIDARMPPFAAELVRHLVAA
jgi:8-oxo-dGTP pyrophosphatase MutT (NUDIX family)